jgi:Flp pilus assembly pilin Flp
MDVFTRTAAGATYLRARWRLWLGLLQGSHRSSAGEAGQDLAEYGLLVGFIAIVVLVAVMVLGTSLSTFWREVADLVAAGLS